MVLTFPDNLSEGAKLLDDNQGEAIYEFETGGAESEKGVRTKFFDRSDELWNQIEGYTEYKR